MRTRHGGESNDRQHGETGAHLATRDREAPLPALAELVERYCAAAGGRRTVRSGINEASIRNMLRGLFSHFAAGNQSKIIADTLDTIVSVLVKTNE